MTYVPKITNETYTLIHLTMTTLCELEPDQLFVLQLARIHYVFSESTVLYKLIKLLNSLYLHEPNIMSARQNGTHSYFGICFYSK